jgi:hypothetical protein
VGYKAGAGSAVGRRTGAGSMTTGTQPPLALRGLQSARISGAGPVGTAAGGMFQHPLVGPTGWRLLNDVSDDAGSHVRRTDPTAQRPA